MKDENNHTTELTSSCRCFTGNHRLLIEHQYLGMDKNYASVSLLVCSVCGQKWLRYLYEFESVTASGRWYLGAIDLDQASSLSAEDAKDTLENISWYFYGGSYYGGQTGRSSGKIQLNP